MKRLTLLLGIAGLLAAAWASPAFAAYLPRPAYKAPVYVAPAVFSWTGSYLGVNGGYGWAKSDWSSAATIGSVDAEGWLIGGTFGYNMQTGNWVWGLEGDIDLSTVKGSTTGGTGVCAAAGCEPATAGSEPAAAVSATPSTASCPTSPAARRSVTVAGRQPDQDAVRLDRRRRRGMGVPRRMVGEGGISLRRPRQDHLRRGDLRRRHRCDVQGEHRLRRRELPLLTPEPAPAAGRVD